MSQNKDENSYPKQSDGDVDSDSDQGSVIEDSSTAIQLFRTGERGSGYRTRNDPSSVYQRTTITERRGIIEVRCKSREVVHGRLSNDSDENATLLVYDVFLDATRRARRVRSAKVEFEFSSIVAGAAAPEVEAIAPARRVTLLPSTQYESLTHGAAVSATAGQFIALGGTTNWERTVERTTNDDARVIGYIFSDDYGKGIGAGWSLSENPTIQSGTPSFLRVAMLVKRGNDRFQCRVKINVEADWKSEMGRLFGSTPHDDPILFDPGLPPTNRIRKDGYDVENLGAVDLDAFVEIEFGRTLTE